MLAYNYARLLLLVTTVLLVRRVQFEGRPSTLLGRRHRLRGWCQQWCSVLGTRFDYSLWTRVVGLYSVPCSWTFYLKLAAMKKNGNEFCREYNIASCCLIFTCVSYAEARNSYRLDVRLSVRPSVRLSVTRWHPIKTAEYIVMLSSPHDSPFILVLCISRCSRNSPLRGR